MSSKENLANQEPDNEATNSGGLRRRNFVESAQHKIEQGTLESLSNHQIKIIIKYHSLYF